MDTEDIRLFALAADLLNISKAGRQLGLAPAVASTRLSRLKKLLGADLLHRSTRMVSLSRDGAAFLRYAKEILRQQDAAFVRLGQDNPEVGGTLRFAASSTFTQRFVMPILPDFLTRFPGIDLDLKLSDTPARVIEGGFDLALRNHALEPSSHRARKLADDRRILCASPDYLTRHGTPRKPDELAEHRLLVFMDGTARKLKNRQQNTTAFYPPPGASGRVVFDDGACMRIATEYGAGISINACWSVYRELQEGKLVQVLPEYEIDDQSAIWLVYSKSNALPARVRVFIDFLLERIGDPPVWERALS